MGRWWKSGRVYKTTLAAGGVTALLLVAACGDKEAEIAAAVNNETTTVATVALDPAQAPVIQKAIDDYLQLVEGPADRRIVRHDAVKVTPGSTAFDVAIEGITIGPKGEGGLVIGTLGYRLTPKGTDGFIASDLTHAPSLSFMDKDGKETGTVSFTTKTFSGEWSSNLQTFLALDWQAEKIITKDNAPDGGDMTASSLMVNLASADKGNGLYDQTVKLELSGFSTKNETGESFGLGKTIVASTMSGIKLKEYVAKTREMQTLMAEIAGITAQAQAQAQAQAGVQGSGGTAPAGISDEQAARLSGMIKDMPGLIDGISSDINVEDISFKKAGDTEPFRLARGNLAIGFTGLGAEKATVNFAIGHDGLVIKSPDFAQNPLFAKLLPAAGKLDLNLTDVPSKELWQLIGENFPGLITADPARSEAAANVMFVAMQQLLEKASMKLAVAPSGLTSEVLQLDATGAFDVKPDAVFGLAGTLDVGLHGLDEAMKLANEAAPNSPDAAQIVGGLAMLQSMAKRETGSDGKPVDKLKLEVDAAGVAKVNGMPLSGM